MHFASSPRRAARTAALGVAILGVTAGAALAVAHPAAAASALGAVESAVTCATTTACVVGNNTSSGPGVAGVSKSGIGITATGATVGMVATGVIGAKGTGSSGYGVRGLSTSSDGVFGQSTSGQAGVAGTTPSKYGVFGYTTANNSGATGVYGLSVSGYGMYGTTNSGEGYGLVGYTSDEGVGTYGGSNNGYGVEAVSENGLGLYGLSPEGTAVYGYSSDVGYGVVAQANSGPALYATSESGFAMQAFANGDDALYARNANGNAIDAEGTYIGLLGRSPAGGSTTFPIVATDQNANDLFFVDSAGNVNYHGGLFHFARVTGGATVKSFGAETSSPTLEDTGTAQLVNGIATVRLDSTFAASIDTSSAYRVFITPDGDTRGLFVASKSPSGFVVRETQGGKSTLSFDYRIVATSFGHAGQRMAVASMASFPHAAAPAVSKRPAVPAVKVPAVPNTAH